MSGSPEPKWKGFPVYSGMDRAETWYFRRDVHGWELRDHEGYVRYVGATWLESLPKILLIVANYGFTCKVS